MKKICIIIIFALISSAVAHADVKVIGRGDSMSIDTTGFPEKMIEANTVMMQKCTQCHSIERIVIGLNTGVSPITKISFSRETAPSIVKRMFSKENSNLTRKEALMILQYINFLLDHKLTALQKNNLSRIR